MICNTQICSEQQPEWTMCISAQVQSAQSNSQSLQFQWQFNIVCCRLKWRSVEGHQGDTKCPYHDIYHPLAIYNQQQNYKKTDLKSKQTFDVPLFNSMLNIPYTWALSKHKTILKIQNYLINRIISVNGGHDLNLCFTHSTWIKWYAHTN